MFSGEDESGEFLCRSAEKHPQYVFYQLLAATYAQAAADKLRYAKRAFWLNRSDQHVQEIFYAASYLYGAGRLPDPPDKTLSFVCNRPFETLELGSGGSLNSCCSSWLFEPVGWVRPEGFDSAWSGKAIERQRRDLAAGEYSPCSALLCGYFHDKARGVERRFPLYEPADPDRPPTVAPDAPLSLHLSNDLSCSLRCPSCRTGPIVANSAEQARIAAEQTPQIVAALPKLKRIWITGSGDPFASRHYRELLALLQTPAHRHIVIDMQTNGVLFDEREWRRFDFDGRLGVVIVSIDAGARATYETVRAGGDWARLMRNLEFLGAKRSQGHIQRLRLDAVIQACNFREIPAIVEIASAMGFDQCYFSVLTNWGHMSLQAFCESFVFSADHPDFAEFCSIYDEFRADERIDWGNLPRWTLARAGAQ
jgi:wyosine [tRNA(Phe)-imidazoG37] synthetase (radical SAM superfamily)